MSPLIQHLISEIDSNTPDNDLNEVLLTARQAIFKFNGSQEYSPEALDGWQDELQETYLTSEEISALVAHLKGFIRRHPDQPLVGTAIWALTATNSINEAHFFRNQIIIHADARRFHPVDQADYGLLRLGLDHIRWDSLQEVGYRPGYERPNSYWTAVKIYLRRSHYQRMRAAHKSLR